MSKTADEITQIAAKTVTRKGAPRRRADSRPGTKPEIDDREPLDVWLQGQSPEGAAAIAARTALRVAPPISRDARKARSEQDVSSFLALTHAVFRASALARIAAEYPARANALNAVALVAAARAAAAEAAAARDPADRAIGIAAPALAAAADAADAASICALAGAADAAALAAPCAIPFTAPSSPSFLDLYATADGAIRAETRFDASALPRLGARGLSDLPLWSCGAADWVEGAWEALRLALPTDQGWDVWIDWYEDRLRGGSRGEAYELVFVSAPLDVWDKGPAAANAWIEEHLPEESGRCRALGTRKSLPGRV
ncbi:MAG TPA: hypothetical protein VJY34_15655 [Roseiarcus sp.]|nr:hypothetical protein [Roseiarcus sp.]